MTPWLSDHFSIFGLAFFALKSLLGFARQWSLEKIVILTALKPRCHVKIIKYRTWAIKGATCVSRGTGAVMVKFLC